MKRLLLALVGTTLLLSCQTTIRGEAGPLSATSAATAPAGFTREAFERDYPLPAALSGLMRIGVTEYEARSRGLGYSLKYASRDAVVDVYVYDLGHSDIGGSLADPVIDAAFRQAVADIESVGASGSYANLRLWRNETITVAGSDFLLAEFSFQANGVDKTSYLLVRPLRGKILKLRLTFNAARSETVLASCLVMVAELLASLGR